MDRLKDFLYDKNDIILTLVILLIAGVIVFWRMDVIANYPKTLAKETDTVKTTQETVGNTQEEKTSDSTKAPLWEDEKLTKDVTVSLPSGSVSSAVQPLIEAGLFESYEQFEKICSAAGYTPEKIKAATYTFAKGCTRTDVARQLTQ